MKHSFVNVFAELRANKTEKPRTPLRMFSEMAEEFGLTSAQLVGHMNDSAHPAPKPVMRHGSNAARGRVTYYDPKEMRAWWKLHNSKEK
jgi:hypothetical protein